MFTDFYIIVEWSSVTHVTHSASISYRTGQQPGSDLRIVSVELLPCKNGESSVPPSFYPENLLIPDECDRFLGVISQNDTQAKRPPPPSLKNPSMKQQQQFQSPDLSCSIKSPLYFASLYLRVPQPDLLINPLSHTHTQKKPRQLLTPFRPLEVIYGQGSKSTSKMHSINHSPALRFRG